MKRQNPPQSHIEKAEDIEKFLKPLTIAFIYAIVAVLWAIFVSLTLAILVSSFHLNPSGLILGIFIAAGIAPLIFAIVAYFIAPHDPLSSYIGDLAKIWRRPLELRSEDCAFHELLMDGEALCFKMAFHYPLNYQTADVKERLYTYVNAVLAKDCATRVTIPTNQEVEEAIDPPLEVLASECGIPVLYSEIREVCKIMGPPAVASGNQGGDYWRTGTYQ